MNEELKTNVRFKDKENNLFNVSFEITNRNGYPEFSMCGEGSGSMGQCYDGIKPKNAKQERLIELWKTYHLNGMNAGTPKQTEMIKEMEKKTEYSYEKACDYLNSFDKDGKALTCFDLKEIEKEREDIKARISEVESEIFILNEEKDRIKSLSGGGFIIIKDLNISEHYNTDLQYRNIFKKEFSKREKKLADLKIILEQAQEKTMLYDRDSEGVLYKYGATWHKVDLPKGLWKEVEQLVKDITKIEDFSKAKGGSWEDIDDYKIVALGKYLELDPKEAEEDITEGYGDTYSYCGTDYYVLTESEAQDKAEDYLGDELWQMAVESGNTEMGKQEWIEWVISQDGYGTTLNSYDGTEYHDSDNDVYIMRC